MKAKFEFKVSGFIIGLLVVSMVAASMGTFLSGIETGLDVSSNTTLSQYDISEDLASNIAETRNSTEIKKDTGIVDIIGGYFASGWGAIKTAGSSLDLFSSMMGDLSNDIPFFGFFEKYLTSIFITIIIIGVFVTALLKMRV